MHQNFPANVESSFKYTKDVVVVYSSWIMFIFLLLYVDIDNFCVVLFVYICFGFFLGGGNIVTHMGNWRRICFSHYLSIDYRFNNMRGKARDILILQRG
jgi:hypothetical protein